MILSNDLGTSEQCLYASDVVSSQVLTRVLVLFRLYLTGLCSQFLSSKVDNKATRGVLAIFNFVPEKNKEIQNVSCIESCLSNREYHYE